EPAGRVEREEGAASVEIEAVRLGGGSAGADDEIEIPVGIDVDEPDGGRRVRVGADLLARTEARPDFGRPGREREVDEVRLAVVAGHDVQELIAVHVTQRDGRRAARLGAQADRRGGAGAWGP